MEDQTATIPTTPKPVASGIDKTALVVIIMFLGGLWHKFYLRKYGQECCTRPFLTLIPGIIATVEDHLPHETQNRAGRALPFGIKGNAAAVAVEIGVDFSGGDDRHTRRACDPTLYASHR
ncbi:MAG: hypothetical protein IPN71_12310 [Fibrobacteres bacterium]|nr:hypothetical protein [Fibrobacterota bacterium]